MWLFEMECLNFVFVIILEGIMLFVCLDLFLLYDVKIFVDMFFDICFMCRMMCDIKERGRIIDFVVK